MSSSGSIEVRTLDTEMPVKHVEILGTMRWVIRSHQIEWMVWLSAQNTDDKGICINVHMLLYALTAYANLYRHIIALWFVEQFASVHAAKYFRSQESFLLFDFLQNAFILLSASRQIRQYFVHWTVWYVLVGRISSLTCNNRKRRITFNCSIWRIWHVYCALPNGIVM